MQKQLQMIKQDESQLNNCKNCRDSVVLTVPFHPKSKYFSKQDFEFEHWIPMKKFTHIFKEIVHTKMKICQQRTHPQVIQYVDEIVSASEQIWKNVAVTSGAGPRAVGTERGRWSE